MEETQAIITDPWWAEQGYLAGKEIGGGLWICLAKMMFTYRLMICDEWSVYEFYCYPHEYVATAVIAFNDWNGEGDPLSGWVKHHPSMRRRNRDGTPLLHESLAEYAGDEYRSGDS